MPDMATQLAACARLVRLDRPIGTILLLWPALWALWAAAKGMPAPWTLTVFCSGAFLVRSAGCAINDYMDRDIDPRVERTRSRPLATGEMRPWQALAVFAVLSSIAFALVLSLGTMVTIMAAAGLVLAVLYPLGKRYLAVPQLVLGVAFSWSIPMAFIAVTGTIPAAAILLFAACVSWVVGYDTIYALADKDDDLAIGVNSSAIYFGSYAREVAIGLHVLCLVLLSVYGIITGLHLAWYSCLVAAAAIVLWQWYLLREISAANCIRAFTLNGWFGLMPFTGLVIDTWPR